MKASIIALLTTSFILTGCTSDETYESDVTAINLVNNELNIIWFDKNNDEEMSLSPDSALEYGQATIEQTLYQDESYSSYSFKATDGNTLEDVIEKTSFSLSHDEEYVVFAYLDQNEDSQLEPTLGAVFVKDEDIADNQYRVIIMHTFSSNTGLIDVYIGDKLVAEDLEYGDGSEYINLNIDNTQLKITKADSIAPILEYTIEPVEDEFHTIFIAPETTDNYNAAAFVVVDKDED
ncbi:DUF4397 domain-containing protein [Pseudoalteromonas sp. C2R02]|uniref:DUF4397 domain-containing protein n=1 Tax=Pseudoalteromonas sp. C2R02 TaxID=2841565 RepID=UPI001C099837|nr:DUF4397 domain-containing protein [Pseudoalteromonas sp. C2R02]MBU2967812.1 DUF4397 domain-containing protein [Pseudoalteromonas sp. C2R02]